MATVDLDGFREQFPGISETDHDDDAVNRALDEAKQLTDKISLATLYCAAHLLTLDSDIASDTQRPGEVIEAKVGPLTTKHAPQASGESSGRQAFFTRTEYGRRMLALESRNVRARLSICVG